jgi:hypothetical protein
MVCADVNVLEDNIDTKKKNTETVIDTGKEVGLEVNAGKTKYVLILCQQNGGQNYNLKIGN